MSVIERLIFAIERLLWQMTIVSREFGLCISYRECRRRNKCYPLIGIDQKLKNIVLEKVIDIENANIDSALLGR